VVCSPFQLQRTAQTNSGNKSIQIQPLLAIAANKICPAKHKPAAKTEAAYKKLNGKGENGLNRGILFIRRYTHYGKNAQKLIKTYKCIQMTVLI